VPRRANEDRIAVQRFVQASHVPVIGMGLARSEGVTVLPRFTGPFEDPLCWLSPSRMSRRAVDISRCLFMTSSYSSSACESRIYGLHALLAVPMAAHQLVLDSSLPPSPALHDALMLRAEDARRSSSSESRSARAGVPWHRKRPRSYCRCAVTRALPCHDVQPPASPPARARAR